MRLSTPEILGLLVLLGILVSALHALLILRLGRSLREAQQVALLALAESLARSAREDLARETERLRNAQSQHAADLRLELAGALHHTREELRESLALSRSETAKAVSDFTRETATRSGELQQRIGQSLQEMRADNEKRLNEMRGVVEEKLQKTLEARLGESFKQVSERLEAVSRGLGEVQQITANINDLKRVMGNVKTRGVWGETFLESLLGDALVPEKQFVKNFRPRERSAETVEFAIRLPGAGDDPVYLPVDSKFPREDFERILDASERGDSEGLRRAQKNLADTVLRFAADVSKYINPPRTTDFAVLFLPTEGLYAEVLRQPGMESALKEKHVLVTGPSTMLGVLNSLRVGFQTLVVQKKSAEIGKLLGAVKRDFGTFGALLDKVHKKIEEAGSVVHQAAERHRILTRKMNGVSELPDAEMRSLLGLEAGEPATLLPPSEMTERPGGGKTLPDSLFPEAS